MNRRKFFAFLGIGAASAVVPKVLRGATLKPSLLDVTIAQHNVLMNQVPASRIPISWAEINRKMNILDPEQEIERCFREQESLEKTRIENAFRFLKYFNEKYGEKLICLDDLAKWRKA